MPADGPGAYDVTLLVLYSLTVVAFAANYVHTRRSQNKAVVTVRDKLPTITYGRNTYIEPRVIAQQLAAHLEASHSSF
jgi:hypothetical protein